jgi:hypothetical protein
MTKERNHIEAERLIREVLESGRLQQTVWERAALEWLGEDTVYCHCLEPIWKVWKDDSTYCTKCGWHKQPETEVPNTPLGRTFAEQPQRQIIDSALQTLGSPPEPGDAKQTLVERLREADPGSAQRALGSDILGAAADEIERLQAAVSEAAQRFDMAAAEIKNQGWRITRDDAYTIDCYSDVLRSAAAATRDRIPTPSFPRPLQVEPGDAKP